MKKKVKLEESLAHMMENLIKIFANSKRSKDLENLLDILEDSTEL